MPVLTQSKVGMPLAAAVPAFKSVVQSLNGAPGSAVELSVDLQRDLQMPVDASLHVPVRVTALSVDNDTQVRITLSPLAEQPYYPRFDGSLCIQARSNDACAIVLAGDYVVPFGELGRTVDETFLRGAALASLQRFADRLAREIHRRTEERALS